MMDSSTIWCRWSLPPSQNTSAAGDSSKKPGGGGAGAGGPGGYPAPAPLVSTHPLGVHGNHIGTTTVMSEKSTTSSTGSSTFFSLSFPTSLARRLTALRLRCVNPAAKAPVSTPTSAAGNTERRCVETFLFTWNTVDMSGVTVPNDPVVSAMACCADSKNLSVKSAVMHAKNVSTASAGDQCDATSSYANSKPPMGAPNAVATPHAAPAVTKSRLSLSFLNRRNETTPSVIQRGVVNPSAPVSPCDRPAAMVAPRWIMGPSGPTGRPLATAHIVLTNFTTNVRRSNTFGTSIPFRYAMTSGTPLPLAACAKYATGYAARNTSAPLYVVLNTQARNTCLRFNKSRSVSNFKSDRPSIPVYSTRAMSPTPSPTAKNKIHRSTFR
mmetsp:Transcript_6168/g.24983  ORF Transcript_6168/g.24983 Transcript_6168/m.24983 type:complete len:382 (+) Transcript_6168:1464-2609(+)